MESSQEFFVESEKGMEFRMVITKLESGGFQWGYSESKNSIDSVLYTQPINPTSLKPYRNANIAFENMIQDVIKLLKEQGKDNIKDLALLLKVYRRIKCFLIDCEYGPAEVIHSPERRPSGAGERRGCG